MRRVLLTGTLLLPLLVLTVPGISISQQPTSVWVDANGNVHSSPPEAQPQAGATQTLPGSVPPASPTPGYNPPAGVAQVFAMANQMHSYAAWRDPAEGAFSVSLPVGWQISGGTVRSSRIEAHYVVRAQSPGGGVQVFMDDPRIMIREVPNKGTQMMGTRIGQVMPSASGTKLVLEPYRAGDQFAAEYVQQGFCPTATNMRGGLLADQSQALNMEFGPIAQAEGKTIHVDAGEVTFECGGRVGYVYAITAQAWQPGGDVSLWAVYRIAGYLASPAESGMAADVVHEALGTFQMNPAWLQSYARESGDIQGNVVRESNAITQATIEREQAMNAAMVASIEKARAAAAANSHAIAGTGSSSSGGSGNGHDYNAQLQQKTVCNDLGHCQKVDADITNWWSDCSGKFYPGPESGGPPPASQSACWSRGH